MSFGVSARVADRPVAVVTGASRGIGLAACRLLARTHRLVLVARPGEALEQAVAELAAAGADAAAAPTELTSQGEVEATCAELRERHPRIAAVVNNAGGTPVAAFDSDEADWEGTLTLNLSAAAWLIRGLLPALGDGSAIVNVGSVMSHASVAGLTAYSAAKAGLDQLTRALAVELGSRGIRVNAISPGFIETDLFESHHPPARRRALAAAHPLGRIGAPEEVAEVIAWLCGPSSSFVSGAVLPVDGGLAARLAIPQLLDPTSSRRSE